MAPQSVPVEVKKQRERDRGRKRRQQSRYQGQIERLQEADSHETVWLVSQVHHMEVDTTNCHLREHSLLGDPAASSAGGRRLLRETSNFEDACLGNDTSLRNYTSSATISSAVPVVRSPRNTRRTSSVFRAEADGMGARGVLEQRSFESAATPELSDTDEESQPAIGRPRRDPALSGRELT